MDNSYEDKLSWYELFHLIIIPSTIQTGPKGIKFQNVNTRQHPLLRLKKMAPIIYFFIEKKRLFLIISKT